MEYSETAIVVLGYQKAAVTERCLLSARESGYLNTNFLLVDNGSKPGLYDKLLLKFPEIEFCRLEVNRGFAGGWNAGLRTALQKNVRGVFFASNDCEFQPDVVESCAAQAGESGASLIAPKVLHRRKPDRIQSFGGYFDRENFELNHYEEDYGSTWLGESDYIPGSAFWISSEAFQALGGMDEAYFCYWEDVDFSFRARAAGFKLARCPEAVLFHKGRKTTGKKLLYTTYYYWRNRIRFCRQHLSPDDWEVARDKLARELARLKERWSARQDSLRLAYLPELEAGLKEK